MAGCLGGRALAAICGAFAEDYAGAHGGMPDLLVWQRCPEQAAAEQAQAAGGEAEAEAGKQAQFPFGEARLVEVKSPSDRLSDKQARPPTVTLQTEPCVPRRVPSDPPRSTDPPTRSVPGLSCSRAVGPPPRSAESSTAGAPTPPPSGRTTRGERSGRCLRPRSRRRPNGTPPGPLLPRRQQRTPSSPLRYTRRRLPRRRPLRCRRQLKNSSRKRGSHARVGRGCGSRSGRCPPRPRRTKGRTAG